MGEPSVIEKLGAPTVPVFEVKGLGIICAYDVNHDGQFVYNDGDRVYRSSLSNPHKCVTPLSSILWDDSTIENLRDTITENNDTEMKILIGLPIAVLIIVLGGAWLAALIGL